MMPSMNINEFSKIAHTPFTAASPLFFCFLRLCCVSVCCFLGASGFESAVNFFISVSTEASPSLVWSPTPPAGRVASPAIHVEGYCKGSSKLLAETVADHSNNNEGLAGDMCKYVG